MNIQWYQAEKLQEFGQRLDANNGFYQVGWCGKAECEEALKNYKGTIRCLIEEKCHSSCFNCNTPSKTDVLVAKAY
jgi:hypothetical protein